MPRIYLTSHICPTTNKAVSSVRENPSTHMKHHTQTLREREKNKTCGSRVVTLRRQDNTNRFIRSASHFQQQVQETPSRPNETAEVRRRGHNQPNTPKTPVNTKEKERKLGSQESPGGAGEDFEHSKLEDHPLPSWSFRFYEGKGESNQPPSPP